MKTQLFILSAIFLSFNTFSQIPNYLPSNGLVGWWPFNGNANDESGNGNNGTVNGATLSTDRFGMANMAYYFSSVGCATYISCNINSTSVISGVSICFWAQRIGPGCISPRIMKFYAPNDGPGTHVFGWPNGNTNPSTAFVTSTQNGPFYQFNNISDSTWAHIVYTNDGSTVKLYQDGLLLSSNISSGAISLAGNANFGRMTNPANDAFNGKLDDIGIWNRALTACEIQDLYQAQLNSASLNISAGADQSICNGDNATLSGVGGSAYLWNNNVVDGQAFTPAQSSSYVLTGTDSLGCTGTDTVNITVLENASTTLTETALDSYTLNGQTYTQSGTYTQTVPAANGCDSTITLNLTLNFTGINELGTSAKKLLRITDLNGKTIPQRKNTLMLFIYEDGTVERVVELED